MKLIYCIFLGLDTITDDNNMEDRTMDNQKHTKVLSVKMEKKKVIMDFIKSTMYLNYFKSTQKKKVQMQTSNPIEDKSKYRKRDQKKRGKHILKKYYK